MMFDALVRAAFGVIEHLRKCHVGNVCVSRRKLEITDVE